MPDCFIRTFVVFLPAMEADEWISHFIHVEISTIQINCSNNWWFFFFFWGGGGGGWGAWGAITLFLHLKPRFTGDRIWLSNYRPLIIKYYIAYVTWWHNVPCSDSRFRSQRLFLTLTVRQNRSHMVAAQQNHPNMDQYPMKCISRWPK